MSAQKRYRRTSMRMPFWDYAGNGSYFLTLVTKDRVCNLSEIVKGEVILSDFGKIVNEEWLRSFEIRKELTCDVYVIMPNHIHAIVDLKKPLDEKEKKERLSDMLFPSKESDDFSMESQGSSMGSHGLSMGSHGFSMGSHGRAILHRKPKSISSFIAGFKSSVNTKIDDFIDEHQLKIPKYNKKNPFFQSNFYDHVIRNLKAYYYIKRYIINNPKKWEGDNFNY